MYERKAILPMGYLRLFFTGHVLLRKASGWDNNKFGCYPADKNFVIVPTKFNKRLFSGTIKIRKIEINSLVRRPASEYY